MPHANHRIKKSLKKEIQQIRAVKGRVCLSAEFFNQGTHKIRGLCSLDRSIPKLIGGSFMQIYRFGCRGDHRHPYPDVWLFAKPKWADSQQGTIGLMKYLKRGLRQRVPDDPELDADRFTIHDIGNSGGFFNGELSAPAPGRW